MEPLSALSLAGNILQFIEFTSHLLSTSVEIYKSSTGTLDSKVALEEIYQRLSYLSVSLITASRNTQPSASELALRSIASSCNDDCIRLLAVLNDIRVDEGSHRLWKSFRAALKLAWRGEQEIEKLATRLRDRQSMMTLHICAVSNEWLQSVNQKLRELEKQNTDLQLQHLGKLEEMSTDLQAVKLQISRSRTSDPNFTFSSAELNELTNKVSNLSLIRRDIMKEQVFLSSLDFGSRRARHEMIPEAHAQTFSWVFETSDHNATSHNTYMRWLRESGGMFWITGKPGSGKSTLMKYLANHMNTVKAAEQWAAPEKVVVASHFFWLPGNSMQKSMEGLFRSLLYETFRQCPQLMAEACPYRWQNILPLPTKQDWKFKELIDCFQAIKANAKSTVKLCFFIDGLDEFDGDHTDICQALSEIAECSRIKLCVASRPLNEFQHQFGADESSVLQVHELTKGDITNYARSRLEEHPCWSTLGLDAQAAQLFFAKIADLARGVFLWVTLVTKSLRSGLANSDTIEDLNARLDVMPKTLEAFYKSMLDSVEPIYRRKSANLLQMQLVSSSNLPWMVALLHEHEYSDPDYAITMPRTTLTHTDVQSLHERATRRLNAKCCCILEIRSGQLEFIHRTASDYLKSPEMTDYIHVRNGEGFNPHLSILKARVACFKMCVLSSVETCAPVSEYNLWEDTSLFIDVLREAEVARLNGAGDDEVFKIIDCLEDISVLPGYPEKEYCMDIWSMPIGAFFGPWNTSPFKLHLIRAMTADYAAVKLSNNAKYFHGMSRPVLWSLMRAFCGRIKKADHRRWMKFLHLLLQYGYDLNETQQFIRPNGCSIRMGSSPWEECGRRTPPNSPRTFSFSIIPDIIGEHQLVSLSAWPDYLLTCGICGHFGPRRRVERVLHTKCKNLSWGIRDLPSYHLKLALDDGVFPLLLRHGADPNAHPTPLTTAWTDFVCFGIKYPSVVLASEPYLGTIDDFFKHGADLSSPTLGLTLRPGDASSRLPLRMVTGWSTFCEALEDITGSETGEELEIISQITTKMIKQAMNTRWPVGRLPLIIKNVFPETLHEPMLDDFREASRRN
ncbi:hypothetical protein F5Y02DRAFT_55953 [Annulohypoxylon stygium]|nr:hypothetical protein F5Y02DRAFT_55953 [Annulohypoxylon stygium]